MSFTIEKHEELIFKYVGDAVIAIFVSNNDVHADIPLNAVRTWLRP